MQAKYIQHTNIPEKEFEDVIKRFDNVTEVVSNAYNIGKESLISILRDEVSTPGMTSSTLKLALSLMIGRCRRKQEFDSVKKEIRRSLLVATNFRCAEKYEAG